MTPIPSFAERAVAEFEKRLGGFIATTGKRAKQDRDNAWFLAKLAEAEQRGRDSAVDYIEKNTNPKAAGKMTNQEWFAHSDFILAYNDVLEAARRLTTPS